MCDQQDPGGKIWRKSPPFAITSRTSGSASRRSGGIFDYDGKSQRLEEVELELADPKVWDDQDRARDLNKERAALDEVVGVLSRLGESLADMDELAELAAAEDDRDALVDVSAELDGLEADLAGLEFRRMFQGETDEANAFLDRPARTGYRLPDPV